MTTTNAARWEPGNPAVPRPIPRAAATVTTGLFTALMTVSGVLYLLRPVFIVEALEPLGYPIYFLKLLGAAKLLGVVGLLLPARPTLREWVYAGFTFDLVAAVVSHVATDGAAHAIPPMVVLSLLATSRSLRLRMARETAR